MRFEIEFDGESRSFRGASLKVGSLNFLIRILQFYRNGFFSKVFETKFLLETKKITKNEIRVVCVC